MVCSTCTILSSILRNNVMTAVALWVSLSHLSDFYFSIVKLNIYMNLYMSQCTIALVHIIAKFEKNKPTKFLNIFKNVQKLKFIFEIIFFFFCCRCLSSPLYIAYEKYIYAQKTFDIISVFKPDIPL